MIKKKILRKFGFKTDQEGIINRYLREDGGWNEHLKKTKQQIKDFAENTENQKVVVLGSGWLLDIPYEELSNIFSEVLLVDIIHPRQIINKIKNIKNIALLATDISGFVQPVYNLLKANMNSKIEIDTITPLVDERLLNEIKSASFVVSVNLLNQLDILICDFIKKHNLFSQENINALRKKIQQYHFDILPKDKSLIITDYKEINTKKNASVKEKKLVYITLPENNVINKWKWDFDLKKTYHSNCETIFKVKALKV